MHMAPRVAIPHNAEELQEMLSDRKVMSDLLSSSEGFGEFVESYANLRIKNAPDETGQLNEQIEKTMINWLRDNEVEGIKRLNLDPHSRQHKSHNALYNKKAAGAAFDGEFENSADFFRATWHNAPNLSNWASVSQQLDRVRKIQNSFGSTIPADGGFLIPETLRSQLLELALENSIVRPRATIIPMESLRVPIPAIDTTSNASSVYGGIVCYWTEEGAALTESQARFMRVVLEANKLTAYAEMPNELIADATAFGGFFDQKFPLAIGYYEDVAFFNGDGAGQPLGFMNVGNGSLVAVTKETGQAANTILWQNIVKMYSRMLPTSLNKAVWIVSPDTFPELATMALNVGTGGSAIWLNSGADGPPMTILGRPVVVTEKAKALGTVGDLNFVDLSYYLVGDRQIMQSMSSPHYRFGNDVTAFRIIQRVDGRPWLNSAITPQNGSSNTLSPFVQMGTR
jgi:HK97 family phage major capsid protein